ncbi:cold-shock protein [Paenibacillus sp. IB182496]|uniref:Cold-shock protein n=1 Tax=Paenibacillus sabuli TaxID=2772509 RepID=A0A927BRX4_9BACL|nr:cold-shock protein [Paenibacillus sabuli]MBD2844791.1 cold-shock protein [Paenibacillus sabuli]
MYYSKKNVEPTPEEETAVWSCSSEGCTCWMRDDFSFQTRPLCPICDSPMIEGSKLLPVLKP